MKKLLLTLCIVLAGATGMDAQTRLQLNNQAPGGGYGASFIILPPLTPTTGTVELRFPTTSGTALIEDNSGITNLTSLNASGPSSFGSSVNIDGGLTIQHNVANDSATRTLGLRFENDPYGGGGDYSGLRMFNRNNTEDMILELYSGNDAGDKINFSVADGTYGVTVNNYPVITTNNASSLLGGSLAGSYWSLGGNSTGTISTLGSNDNYAIAFETNGTERVRLDTDGDLGIGTTSPRTPLHVARAASGAATHIMLMNSAPAGTANSAVQINFANDVGATEIIPNAFIRSENTGGANNAATLSFGTYNGSAVAARMSIDPSGDVTVHGGEFIVDDNNTSGDGQVEIEMFSGSGYGWVYGRNVELRIGTGAAAFPVTVDPGNTGNPVLRIDQNIVSVMDGVDAAIRLQPDGTMSLFGTGSSTGAILFYEPQAGGASYITLKAPALATSYDLVLPADDGSSGQVLTTNGSGTLSWATTGLQYFTETRNTTAPNATVPVHQIIASGSETNIDMALRPKGTGALTADAADGTATGGNKRGTDAVDFQRVRSDASQVASGQQSVLVGGDGNTASGSRSVIVGGRWSSATGNESSVLGGRGHTVTGERAAVSGGFQNTITGMLSGIVGGDNNLIQGSQGFIGGGSANRVTAAFSGVISGQSDTVSNSYSVILGGRGAHLSGAASLLFNGNTGTNNIKVSDGSVAAFANANVWLANTNNTASELRLYEAQATGGTGEFPVSGTNYTAFKAGTQSADITYTLPASAPTTGQALIAGSTPTTLEWGAAGATNLDGLSDAKSGGANFANSLLLGHQSVPSINGADQNVAVGYGTIQNITQGDYNVAMGYGVLANLTTGTANVAIGGLSMQTLSTGTANIAIGMWSMNGASTTGYSNIAIGYEAGFEIDGSAQENTAVGARIFRNQITGDRNTAVGADAMYNGGTGGNNVVIGYSALSNITTGANNVAIGSLAGVGLQTGSGNVFLGNNAGWSETGSDKLYIDNSSTSTPLIYGDFSSDYVTINGTLRMAEPTASGSNFTAFVAQAQAADVTYTLPAADGTSGQMLSTNGSGTLSWATAITSTSSSVYTATSTSGLSYSTNNINLASFTGTYQSITVPAPAAASTVTMPAGTNGQVMYVRFAFTAGTGTVSILNDGGGSTAMVYDGAGSDVIVAHMLYTTAEKWVILSSQYFNN